MCNTLFLNVFYSAFLKPFGFTEKLNLIFMRYRLNNP